MGNGTVLTLVLLLAVVEFPNSLCQEIQDGQKFNDPALKDSDTLTGNRFHPNKFLTTGTATSKLIFQGMQPSAPEAATPPSSHRDQFVHNMYLQPRDDMFKSTTEPKSSMGLELPEVIETDIVGGDDVTHALKQSSVSVDSVYDPPIDYFRCDRCVCHDFTNVTGVYADCTLKPRGFYTFPAKLPKNTLYLDLTRNYMVNLRFEIFSPFPFLSTVVLPFNNIGIIKNDSCIQPLQIVSLDLSNNDITVVEDNSFSCFEVLRSLNIEKNKLQIVSDHMLLGIPKLRNLDLSNNHIQSIDTSAFDELKELVILKLNGNRQLTYGKTKLAPRIFEPLKHLQILHIQDLWMASSQYPISVLLELTSLKELHVDGVNTGHFESSLRVLQNLSTVVIGTGGYCRIHDLYDSYFEGLPFLKTVQLNGCSPKNISHLAFIHNKQLEDLRYIDVTYSLERMFESLSGLQDLPIKSLTFNKILKGFSKLACRSLTGEHVQHLMNMTHLETLNLESNQIALIDYHFVEGLPNTLKHLSLRGNTMSYIRSVLPVHNPAHLPNLTALHEDLQNHDIIFKEGGQQKTRGDHQTFCAQKCDSQSYVTDRKSQSPFTELNDTSSVSRGTWVPHNLRVYTASESFHFGIELLKSNLRKNKVRVYNISNSFLTDWGTKYFSRFIEIADLSDNYCDSLILRFFPINNSLKEFRVAGNFLGNDFANDVDGEKLSRLQGVHYVDFSRNHIQDLPWRFFQGLMAVRVINLSSNNIKHFNVSLAHLKFLTFLDLKKNAVTWISRQTRKDLDSIELDHRVILDLTSNPLPCTCEGIELLKWLATTKVKVINKDFLQCYDEGNKKDFIGDLLERTTSLQRSCASKAYVILAATFSIVVVVLFTASLWIFKNRWWLYYMRNILIARFFGYKRHDEDKVQHYQFDAFIHYSGNDSGFVMRECLQELEEKRKHKVCVEHRDFLLGSYMPCTITNAISNSRVTVAVVSPQFWEGEWSEYGLQMAVMESVHTKRSVLHLLIYKPVDMRDMPRNVLKVYNDNEFSEYPPEDCDEGVKDAFWDAISRVIGHSNDPENAPLEINCNIIF